MSTTTKTIQQHLGEGEGVEAVITMESQHFEDFAAVGLTEKPDIAPVRLAAQDEEGVSVLWLTATDARHLGKWLTAVADRADREGKQVEG